MAIEFNKNESSNMATVLIKGHFNFDMNAEFREVLDCVSESKYGVTVDMSMVDQIDSSALGMLLLLREQCGGNNARIKIIKCRPEIHDVLKMANFQIIFDMDD